MSTLSLPPAFFSLPSIQTRKALLLLDFQNEFVRPSGRLPVQNTQDFLDVVPGLVQSFRRSGDVIWVRTQFEEPRPLIDPDSGGERVVLAAGPLDSKNRKKHRRERGGSLTNIPKIEDDTDPEAYLSGPDPICQAQTPGAQFPAPILSAVDQENDLVIVKSDYSAFQSSGLILSLRSRFVTELYLCGSLSNISVYATALDAARQGFTITLIEDCLGYRSFARHEEAIRRMADIMGANGISVQELLEEQDWQETHEIAHDVSPGQPQKHLQKQGTHSPPQARPQTTTPAGIEGVMDHLVVQGSPPYRQASARMEPAQGSSRDEAERQRIINSLQKVPLLSSSVEIEPDDEIDAEDSETDPWAMPPSKYPRASTRTVRETHSEGPVRRPPARMRRNKVPAGSPPSRRLGSRTAESVPGRASTSPILKTSTTAPAPATATPSATKMTVKKKKKGPTDGILGPSDHIGEGDSRIIHKVDLPLDAFANIRNEVRWQKMYHLSGQVPRLVAVQGSILPDGSIPIYRHPADESPPLLPFTATVDRVRNTVEKMLGYTMNHVLIQLYRDGQDRISEHSDKTLDIVRGTSICNVSFGAQRTMILRTKVSGSASVTSDANDEHDDDGSSACGRQTQRVPMPHESVFVLGPKTNMRWLHGIRPDKRPDTVKTAEEQAFNGERISLTFRAIGTFINPTSQTIWGQGAVAKGGPDVARQVIHGDIDETERLIRAFGRENHDTEFDWDVVYGMGFDVVNFVTPAVARFILSGDAVADIRVRLCLTENGMRYATDTASSQVEARQPVYISPDGKTAVTGDFEILSYLAQLKDIAPRPGVDILRGGSHLRHIAEFTATWRRFQQETKRNAAGFKDLSVWEVTVQEQEQRQGYHYISGAAFGIDDCALWPVLRDIMQRKESILPALKYPYLCSYYHRVEKRGCVRAVLDEMDTEPEPD